MKRFYKEVSLFDSGQGFEVHLDGRSVKLPQSKRTLGIAQKPLAQAVADEWAAQVEQIIPDTMPLMQIVSTCLEKVSVQRAAMHAQLLNYVDTDLLFYRTDKPPQLRALQEAAWDPVIDRFVDQFCVRPQVTYGLVALSQPQALHEAIDQAIAPMTDEYFTVLQIAVPAAGSVMTGLLFTQGDLTPEEVLAIARVEENHKDSLYNADKYGRDPALEKADAAMLRDLQACRQYLDLLAAE